jgi:hypothetical protein
VASQKLCLAPEPFWMYSEKKNSDIVVTFAVFIITTPPIP